MHILLWVPEYPPHHVWWGGAVFKSLAEWFLAEGYKVTVVYWYFKTDQNNKNISFYSKNWINFIRVPELPYPKKKPFLKTVMPVSIKNMWQLYKALKSQEVDKAFIHGYGLIFINQLSFILRCLKIDYIYTLHGAPVSPWKMKWIIKIAYNLYNHTLWKYTLKHASKMTAVSKYTTTFTEFRRYKNTIEVIPNGINIDDYKYDNTLATLLTKWDIKFLSLWRIEWLKGFQYVIPIIALLRKRWINCYYYIAGNDNGYKQKLLEIIKEYHLEEHIIFLGFLNFQEKVNAIYESSFVVIPSLVENYPAVPIEAIICGRVPIWNNVWWIPEIINPNNWVCIDIKITEDVVESVLQLIQSKVKPKKQDYSWKNIIKKYLEL